MNNSNPSGQNLPQSFLTETEAILQQDMPAFIDALQQEAPVSIHLNDKIEFKHNFISVPWCEQGVFLPQRPQFTLDPLWHAGAYYVQESSSMFLQRFLQEFVPPDALVLDMCAAPGGKSILASQHLTDGLLVSNEFVRNRSRILAENIIKWGNANVIVTANAPDAFEQLPHLFDAIIVDAPCSGEGMFRKDENAIAEWSEHNVSQCVDRQKQILSSAWETLAPEGVLIYSTCTYNRRENEQMVQWLLQEYDAQYLPIPLQPDSPVTETEFGYRFFPHKTPGEGLFMAAISKGEGNRKNIKNKSKLTQVKEQHLLNQLLDKQHFTLQSKEDLIMAIPTEYAPLYTLLEQKLYVLHAGITLAQQKGKDFIPHTALAMSKQLNINNVEQRVELSTERALAYLQREAITPEEAQKGYILITNNQIPLGWIKHLGNRSNNLYPENWRIRMAIPNPLPLPFYSL